MKFVSQGSLSSQHTSGMTIYSRHLSSNDRTRMGESMLNHSVSNIYHRQFNIPDNVEGFSYGNLTHLKSQGCLRKVKSEIRTQNRFSNSYMVDIAATQQYYRYLLPDSPIPGYIQYFIQDPFIVHMYGSKQIDLLKFIKNSAIILNLDETGSLISKPPFCKNKIYYYALTLQHSEYSISPVPFAEMISSDHSTAKISYFLNKWYLNTKLSISGGLKIHKIEMDYIVGL